MKQWEYRRHILIGAVLIIGIIVVVHFLSDYGDGSFVNAYGDIALPSGNEPSLAVGGAVATTLQTATSPDGKYAFPEGPQLPLTGSIPSSAL